MLLSLRAALAQAEAPLRVALVRPSDPELITRIEGQTRDLDVKVHVVPATWQDRSPAQAARVAAEHGADFVARIDRTAAGALEVLVYTTETRTLRTRRVNARARRGQLATSAQLEAAAIVLRGELTAAVEAQREAAAIQTETGDPDRGLATPGPGETQAGPSSESSRPPLRAADPRAEPARPEPREPDTAPDPEQKAAEKEAEAEAEDDVERAVEEELEPETSDALEAPLENYSVRRRAWTVRAGVQPSLPIAGQLAVAGLIGGRAQLDWLELGVAVSSALPLDIAHEEGFSVRLRRHAFLAEALGVVPWGPRVRFLLGVDAGVVGYARETRAWPEGFERQKSELPWSPAFGARAELQWLLSREFGIALGAGLTYLVRPTRFAYDPGLLSPDPEIAELREFEPWMCVGVFALIGP